jgi:hypothetical protein
MLDPVKAAEHLADQERRQCGEGDPPRECEDDAAHQPSEELERGERGGLRVHDAVILVLLSGMSRNMSPAR